jgi:hypothetical protein
VVEHRAGIALLCLELALSVVHEVAMTGQIAFFSTERSTGTHVRSGVAVGVEAVGKACIASVSELVSFAVITALLRRVIVVWRFLLIADSGTSVVWAGIGVVPSATSDFLPQLFLEVH